MKCVATCLCCGFSFFSHSHNAVCPSCGALLSRDTDGQFAVIRVGTKHTVKHTPVSNGESVPHG